MSDYRDVSFPGCKIKLADFLRTTGLALDIPLGGNAAFLIDIGLVMVDGEIAGPARLCKVNKRTRLRGREIVTRFGLTDDAKDPRIIGRDRPEGPHLDRGHRYPPDVVRVAAS